MRPCVAIGKIRKMGGSKAVNPLFPTCTDNEYHCHLQSKEKYKKKLFYFIFINLFRGFVFSILLFPFLIVTAINNGREAWLLWVAKGDVVIAVVVDGGHHDVDFDSKRDRSCGASYSYNYYGYYLNENLPLLLTIKDERC